MLCCILNFSFCLVPRYHNKSETEKIGERICQLREANGFSVEAICEMTGFARKTISAIENGSETNTSHLIEIAKAIGIHPMEIFNLPFEIKPRFKLSATSIEKKMLTQRVTKLFAETDFFQSPKFVAEVIQYLFEEYKIKVKSSVASVILTRLVNDGKLKYKKSGRKNVYMKKKK